MHYGEQVNDCIAVYRGMESNGIVGICLENISQLQKNNNE
jgi:hypothetical protein